MSLSVTKVQLANHIKFQLEHLLNSVTYFRHHTTIEDGQENQRQLDELLDQVLGPQEGNYIDYHDLHMQLRDGALDLAINKAAEKTVN